ncbi:MAG: DUF2919 family protein [Rhodospirillaceae bacterium]|jgi:hypothetical protein|nr:DUF2919 family protein [Rhodospirillaceae bacterium]MBT5047699.1 DUF2919 family protein [Rhodospirillaceae bacterium]MBT5455249.1 DUF2919 family protein [Rhodospirillaceae bacterium]
MTEQPRKWDYLSYNRYDVLRLNWLYWTIILFLSRHILVLMFIGFSKGRSGSGPSDPALAALIDPLFFISDVPALALLAFTGSRLPNGGNGARAVWRNGRYFLSASCLLYLALLFWQQGAQILQSHPLTWALIAVNLIALVAIWWSNYLGDLFGEFPDPDPDSKK